MAITIVYFVLRLHLIGLMPRLKLNEWELHLIVLDGEDRTEWIGVQMYGVKVDEHASWNSTELEPCTQCNTV